MLFDKNRVYTAVNAEELKPGDKVCVADTLMGLENRVRHECVAELEEVLPYYNEHRFKAYLGIHNLAYLVERKENCTNCKKNHKFYGGCEHLEAFLDDEEKQRTLVCGEFVKAEPKTTETKKHLCPDCAYIYPECPAAAQDCKFGNGIGNDNIYKCRHHDEEERKADDTCDAWEPAESQATEKGLEELKSMKQKNRPFKDVDELIGVWQEKCPSHNNREKALTMPLIWVRKKLNFSGLKGEFITRFEDSYVDVNGRTVSLHVLFTEYEFLDGSICGVEE